MSAREGYVGNPIERLEDLRLLRGRGQYVDDLTAPGTLHLAFFRSPLAHGLIKSIDTAAARALPGVRLVLTAANL